MIRRMFLKALASTSLVVLLPAKAISALSIGQSRRRPTDKGWPNESDWAALSQRLEGSLENSRSGLNAAIAESGGQVTKSTLKKLVNPFFLQDYSGSTQSLGWLNAWKSAESAKVGIPKTAKDVSELVKFARDHNLRLVIKGGGHSYYGQSCAPDSLLIWTRDLTGITLHDNFVPNNGTASGQTAVSVASGEKFITLYTEAVVKGGMYVQGGGCTSVGVGGHAQSGGFGHFSKYGGMTGSNILEAEVVLANGDIVVANENQHSDLLWALKGGGAGWGVTTRLTLATRKLPARFGFIGCAIKAKDEAAFRKLVDTFITVARENLVSPHWGEQVHFGPEHQMYVKMTFMDIPLAGC